jgi:hypothetical protein
MDATIYRMNRLAAPGHWKLRTQFFQELAAFSASLLSPPNSKVHCNVTVVRRPVTVACRQRG